MQKKYRFFNENKGKWMWAPATMLCAALSPEYFAPFFTVIGTVIAWKQASKPGLMHHYGLLGKAFTVYICWMIIGLFYSNSLISGLASVGLWILMFGGFIMFSLFLDNRNKIDSVIYLGGLSGGIAGFLGIMQMILYHYGGKIVKGLGTLFNPFWHCLDILISKLVTLLPDFITSHMPSTTFHTFDTRACGTFSNPLFFATFEILMLPLAAYGFLHFEDKKKRIISFICMLLCLGGVASSYSRGPYIAVAAVFIILLCYGGKKSLKIAASGSGVLIVLFFTANGIFKRLLTLRSDKDISVNTRELIWSAVFKMAKEKPVFGYGTGFDNVRQMLHNIYGINQPHAHNIIFEILLENGAIGVILFAAVCIIFAVNIFKLIAKGNTECGYAITMLASFSGFFLCGMTDCIFYGLKPLQYTMMIFGLSQAIFNVFLGEEAQHILPKAVRNKISDLKHKITKKI